MAKDLRKFNYFKIGEEVSASRTWGSDFGNGYYNKVTLCQTKILTLTIPKGVNYDVIVENHHIETLILFIEEPMDVLMIKSNSCSNVILKSHKGIGVLHIQGSRFNNRDYNNIDNVIYDKNDIDVTWGNEKKEDSPYTEYKEYQPYKGYKTRTVEKTSLNTDKNDKCLNVAMLPLIALLFYLLFVGFYIL